MNECKGLVSVQCCNFEKDCKFRQDDDCYNPEVMKEALEQKLGMIQPKRKPLPDGTLPLTEEELKEFNALFVKGGEFEDLAVEGNIIFAGIKDVLIPVTIPNVKAIAYLLERFELIKEEQ